MFHLSIVTPEKIFFDDDIKSLTAPGSEGYLGVLTNHAPLITALKPGKVEFYDSKDEIKILAVAGGFLEVSNNKANLLVEAVEFADEIDIERAKTAYENAKKRLKETGKENLDINIQTEKNALERAVNRINIYNETH